MSALNRNEKDGALLRAVLAVQKGPLSSFVRVPSLLWKMNDSSVLGEYEDAMAYIQRVRDLIDSELTAQWVSFPPLYDVLILLI